MPSYIPCLRTRSASDTAIRRLLAARVRRRSSRRRAASCESTREPIQVVAVPDTSESLTLVCRSLGRRAPSPQLSWGRRAPDIGVSQVFGSACSIAYNRCSDLPLWEPLARSPPWREGGIRPWREGAWGESSKCWRGNAAPGLLSVVRVREGDVSDRGACQVTLVEGLRKTRVSRAAAGVSLSQKLLINCRRVPAFAGRGRLLLRSVIGQEYSLCDERQRGRQTRMSNAKPMRILQTRVLAGSFPNTRHGTRSVGGSSSFELL